MNDVKKLKVVMLESENGTGRMKKVVLTAMTEMIGNHESFEYEIYDSFEAFEKEASANGFRGGRFLFCVEIDESGINLDSCRLMKYLCKNGDCMFDSVGGVIIDGKGELFTKELGRRLVFLANASGAAFPGKPLVEATGNLINYDTLAGNWGTDRLHAYIKSCILLIKKVLDFKMVSVDNPKVLAIHASSRKTSNSLQLWTETSKRLCSIEHIEEISIRNGEVWDCRGCKYEACLHFGENAECFYGGVMVEKVYPAILRSDVLVLVCPNYNDSVSANIMAFINRLTALFRTNDFSRKRIYAIIVSGYSGGDIVAQQIIGAINMNKNFILPPRFALIETANGPGDAMCLEGIEGRLDDFAKRILDGN